MSLLSSTKTYREYLPLRKRNDISDVQMRILESADFVVRRANHVVISAVGIKTFCHAIRCARMAHWLEKAPLQIMCLPPEQRIAFAFVFNSISFCYWGTPKWRIDYNGSVLDGSWALIARLGQAMLDGVPLWDASYLAGMSATDFHVIVDGTVSMPLEQDRVAILNQLGNAIELHYGGRFAGLIEAADFNAPGLIAVLCDQVPSFKDEQVYKGRSIGFYKRAQLLATDLHYVLSMEDAEPQRGLSDLEALTACADYKLPQVLRRFGVLQYSVDLAARIDNKLPVDRGSDEEIEIRASTVSAVERIRRILSRTRPGIMACEINDHIWLLGQEKRPDDRPYHQTLTTAY